MKQCDLNDVPVGRLFLIYEHRKTKTFEDKYLLFLRKDSDILSTRLFCYNIRIGGREKRAFDCEVVSVTYYDEDKAFKDITNEDLIKTVFLLTEEEQASILAEFI